MKMTEKNRSPACRLCRIFSWIGSLPTEYTVYAKLLHLKGPAGNLVCNLLLSRVLAVLASKAASERCFKSIL